MKKRLFWLKILLLVLYRFHNGIANKNMNNINQPKIVKLASTPNSELQVPGTEVIPDSKDVPAYNEKKEPSVTKGLSGDELREEKLEKAIEFEQLEQGKNKVEEMMNEIYELDDLDEDQVDEKNGEKNDLIIDVRKDSDGGRVDVDKLKSSKMDKLGKTMGRFGKLLSKTKKKH